MRRLLRRLIVFVLSGALVTLGMTAVFAPGSSAAPMVTETVGGDTHTWTNYTNAGGSAGAVIPAYSSVQISCKLSGGFRVSDGNTWWYQIVSSPWNYSFYVSADALTTTSNVRAAGGYAVRRPGGSRRAVWLRQPNETTGGAANTWTNYTNAGGNEGHTIGGNATGQIACRVAGFRVADGNTWWYQIASVPGTTPSTFGRRLLQQRRDVGRLGTPFVDPAVPTVAGRRHRHRRHRGDAGGAAHTWTNYTKPAGTRAHDRR